MNHNDYYDPYSYSPKPRKNWPVLIVAIVIACLLLGVVFGLVLVIRQASVEGPKGSPSPTLLYTLKPGETLAPQATHQPNPNYTGLPTITAPPIDNAEPIASIAEAMSKTVVTVQVYVQNNLAGTGSGVIISDDGYAITNNHVVTGSDRVTVKLLDGREFAAAVVGTDSRSDLAVLKIANPANLAAASLGSSADLRVGQMVVAIGSPLGMEGTVTQGIVSSLNRTVDHNGVRYKMIQIDAAINPGNSGGPIFDRSGQVIGIVSMKETSTSSEDGTISTEGLGYAIPVDTVKKVAADIIKYGKVPRPGIGITAQTYFEQDYNPVGVEVVSVVAGGAADKSGIKAGDVITALAGKEVAQMEDMTEVLETLSIGQTVEVKLIRASKEVVLQLQLGELQAE